MRETINILLTTAILFATPAIGALDGVVGKETAACKSRETWDEIFKLIDQRDEPAADKLIAAKIDEGECVKLRPGAPIVVDHIEWTTTVARFRFKGDPQIFWAMKGFLDFKPRP
jgi:hypothetical protein